MLQYFKTIWHFFFYFSGKPLIFLTRSNIFYGWWPLFVERSWKNKYFQSKMACPPATYDVISHNHSNWPSLNLPQNVREGWGMRGFPPPPPVRPSVKSQFYFNSDKEVVTEGFFLSSFFACKICNHHPQNKKTNILRLSYVSLSPLASPGAPPPPPPATHLILIVEVTELGLPLPGEGILPIMVYTGRPRLKGV